MKPVHAVLGPALLALFGGCAHEVQVVTVDPAKKCEAAPSLLQACERAAPLAADLTYGQLLDAYQADRERLRRCATQRDDLARVLDTCNAAIDRHNADLAARLKATPAK